MRDLTALDSLRIRGHTVTDMWGWEGDGTCGCFEVPSPTDGSAMRVIASTEGGWDHVSVSRERRCPNWPEMERVKRMFFNADEVAVQYHVPLADHVNNHPYCLHIWRPNDGRQIPVPPAIFV